MNKSKIVLTIFILCLFSCLLFIPYKIFNVNAAIIDKVVNGNFENGLANWTLVGSPTITTAQYYSYNHSVYLPYTAPSTDSIKQIFAIPINKANILNFSVYIKVIGMFDHIDIIIIHDNGTEYNQELIPPESIWYKINIIPFLTTCTIIEGIKIEYNYVSTLVYVDDISLLFDYTIPPTPDYSGAYFKICLGIFCIIAIVLAPILSDKFAKTTMGKIFLLACIWLFFGFLFYAWIYMW